MTPKSSAGELGSRFFGQGRALPYHTALVYTSTVGLDYTI